MNLSYVVKDGSKKTTRISFDPPLSGYEEVKPRLLSMTADAQESLGMVRTHTLCLHSSFPLTNILFHIPDQITSNLHFPPPPNQKPLLRLLTHGSPNLHDNLHVHTLT